MQELWLIDFIKQLAENICFLLMTKKLPQCLCRISSVVPQVWFEGVSFCWFVSCHFIMKETRPRRQTRSKMYKGIRISHQTCFEADLKNVASSKSASLIFFIIFFARACIPPAEERSTHTLVCIVHVLSFSLCTQVSLPFPDENMTDFNESIFSLAQIIFWWWFSSDVLCFLEKTRLNSVVWDDDAAHQNSVSHLHLSFLPKHTVNKEKECCKVIFF